MGSGGRDGSLHGGPPRVVKLSTAGLVYIGMHTTRYSFQTRFDPSLSIAIVLVHVIRDS